MCWQGEVYRPDAWHTIDEATVYLGQPGIYWTAHQGKGSSNISDRAEALDYARCKLQEYVGKFRATFERQYDADFKRRERAASLEAAARKLDFTENA